MRVTGCLLITITVFVVLVGTLPVDNGKDREWIDFKRKYNKHYGNEVEHNFRRSVYYQNQRNIAKHNEKYELGFTSYKLKINQFGDMLFEEYENYMHAPNETINPMKRIPIGEIFVKPNNSMILPDFVDCRKAGAVSPVQDQGLTCGSCWAFSATGALEGQYFRKTGILTPLSAQCLVDCTSGYGNLGCGGGSAALSFQFVVDHKGLEPEAKYSYEGKMRQCPFEMVENEDEDLDVSFVYVNPGDEEALKIAVTTVGPMSAAIDGLHDTFRFYSEGVYYQPTCSASDLDHAVLVIGYGTDSKNRDYWLVKNSWGETWGEGGYFKIARNRDNHCGIASAAIYPIV